MGNCSDNVVRIPVFPGQRVWTANRSEILPMKVISVKLTESGIFITILYDGNDEHNQGWSISQLTEKDEGYLFFLSEADAKAAKAAGKTL